MPDLVDHDAIREWTVARGGRPVIVSTPKPTGGEHTIVRLNFAQPGARLDEMDAAQSDVTNAFDIVEWRDWFAEFEKHNLALRVPEQAAGELDSSHELISRDDV